LSNLRPIQRVKSVTHARRTGSGQHAELLSALLSARRMTYQLDTVGVKKLADRADRADSILQLFPGGI